MFWVVLGHFVIGFMVAIGNLYYNLQYFKRITWQDLFYAFLFFVFGYLTFVGMLFVGLCLCIENHYLVKKEKRLEK